MEFLDLAKKRYSCRKYENRKVEKEKLLKVLEAGRIAPSAVNYQPWKFIVIRDQKLLDEVKTCYGKNWIQSAPIIIVVCGNHQISWKRVDGKDHCDIDVAISTDHMTLAAFDIGLATCWVCKFDVKKCSKTLKLPDYLEPMVLLTIGYPGDSKDINRHETERKKLAEIISWDDYVD